MENLNISIIQESQTNNAQPPEPFIGSIEQLNQIVWLMNDLHSANIADVTINLTNFDLNFKIDNDKYHKDDFLYNELKNYFNDVVKKKIDKRVVGNYTLTHIGKKP